MKLAHWQMFSLRCTTSHDSFCGNFSASLTLLKRDLAERQSNSRFVSRNAHKLLCAAMTASFPLYLQIFVLSSSRIQQRGYDTLFNYTTANPKSGVSKFVKQFPLKTQVGPITLCVHTCIALFRLNVVLSFNVIWSVRTQCNPLWQPYHHEYASESCILDVVIDCTQHSATKAA